MNKKYLQKNWDLQHQAKKTLKISPQRLKNYKKWQRNKRIYQLVETLKNQRVRKDKLFSKWILPPHKTALKITRNKLKTNKSKISMMKQAHQFCQILQILKKFHNNTILLRDFRLSIIIILNYIIKIIQINTELELKTLYHTKLSGKTNRLTNQSLHKHRLV